MPHVRAGAADVVVAVGVEKANSDDKLRSLRLFEGALAAQLDTNLTGNWRRFIHACLPHLERPTATSSA
ncbi:MAG TPA: hypothetical protein VIW24_28120 [Aldersonia sp.]